MPCSKPRLGVRLPNGTIFPTDWNRWMPGFVRLPCGQCAFCRKVRALAWAVRITCEASLFDDNAFLTLTYAVDPGGLNISHMQKFLKRFRRAIEPRKIRFFAVGEYGGEHHRAHWHCIIFGWYPCIEDRYPVRSGLVGSHTVNHAWAEFDSIFGYNSVGDVSPKSAAYVAQYALKKITGKHAEDSYTDGDTGEICHPEVALMSRGGRTGHGIGYKWFDSHCDNVFPSDSVYFNRGLTKPPRYYMEILKMVNPELAAEVSAARVLEFDPLEYDRLLVNDLADTVLKSKMASTNSRHREI